MIFNIHEVAINPETSTWMQTLMSGFIGASVTLIGTVSAMFVVDWLNKRRWQKDGIQKYKNTMLIITINGLIEVYNILGNMIINQGNKERKRCNISQESISKIDSFTSDFFKFYTVYKDKQVEKFFNKNELLKQFVIKLNYNLFDELKSKINIQSKKISIVGEKNFSVDLEDLFKDFPIELRESMDKPPIILINDENYLSELEKLNKSVYDLFKYLLKKVE